MFISISLFLIILFYLSGSLLCIPLVIAYSNNFYTFENKGFLGFIFLSWILFWIVIFIIVSDDFNHPIKTKTKFQKYFQFKFVKRDGRGFRLSDEY